jgi:comEA protein
MERIRDLMTIVLLNLAALGAVVWQLRDPRAAAIRVTPPPTATPGPTVTAVLLHVYVSGAVAAPGVVVLPEGARADDAVRAAGGFRAEADPSAINLAAPLADGWHLQVPAIGDEPAAAAGGGDPAIGGIAAVLAPARAGAPIQGGGAGPVQSASGARVNVNRATAVELESLPGIGPALAGRIVAHRTEHGSFASVDDLLAVAGIGDQTLERLRDLVTVR